MVKSEKKQRKKKRDRERRVSHGCPLQLKCPQTSNLSQSHPKCWLSGACSDFDLGFAEKFPNFFGCDVEKGWGRGDDTFRAYLIRPWQRSQTAWLDLTLRMQYINYLCICNPSRNPFWFSYSPPVPSVYALLYIVFIFGCLINFVTNVQQLRSVRKLQPICKEYRTKN